MVFLCHSLGPHFIKREINDNLLVRVTNYISIPCVLMVIYNVIHISLLPRPKPNNNYTVRESKGLVAMGNQYGPSKKNLKGRKMTDR